jgi:hypothetical protein
MGSPYVPGPLSGEYHRLPRAIRESVQREADRRFREKTGVSRALNPTSASDLRLRRTWLRIRDEVMGKVDQLLEAESLEAELEQLKTDDIVEGIPAEMRWNGWKEAAQLLETWFERPPAVLPNYSSPVTNVIKMDWILGFARAKAVYDEIIKDRIWTNDASQKRFPSIARIPFGAGTFQFGDLYQAVTLVDKQWINTRSITDVTAVDGLAAAIGRFNLHVAIAGKTQRLNALEYSVTVEEVGVYAKDSLDFEGKQFLGFWGYKDTPINNVDFRDWRNRHAAGGDFLVYSDIKRTRLPKPDVMTLKVP